MPPVHHVSPHSSTSSPSCSSSSCSSVPARTSAQLRRGSLTATSKGTCLLLFFAIQLSLPSPLIELPYGFRQSCLLLLTATRTRFLGVFFMSARIGESCQSVIYLSFGGADRPAEIRVCSVCRRAIITLCSVGMHRNGRTDDTFMTFSPRFSPSSFHSTPGKRRTTPSSVSHDTSLLFPSGRVLSHRGPSHVSLVYIILPLDLASS